MRTDTPTRIAERTRLANIHLHEQNWFGRAANRLGLFIANSVDQLTSWADDDRVVFLGATSAGLIRGAAYGMIATFVAAALFPLHTLAVPLLVTLTAASAVGYGIYDGQKGLERNLAKEHSKLPDKIAEKFGALPAKEMPVAPVMNLHVDNAPVEKTLEAHSEAKKIPFATREEMRRNELLAATHR